jgi:hypothetical protein
MSITVNENKFSKGIDDNATSTAITIDASQNVGIGVSNAAEKLHVSAGDSGGTSHSYTDLLLESNSHTAIQLLTPSSSEQALWFGDADSSAAGGISYYHPTNTLSFRAGDDVRMVINASGFVGIGTDAPNIMGWGNALTINSGTQPAVELAKAGVVTGYFASQSDGRLRLGNQVSGQPIQFLTADAGVAAVIDGAGKVGIGESNPSAMLDVSTDAGNGDAGQIVKIANTNTSSGTAKTLTIGTDNYFASNPGMTVVAESGLSFGVGDGSDLANQRDLVINSAGNVGIGTGNPTGDGTSLHIDGASGSYSTLHLTNSTTGGAATDGTYIVTADSDLLIRNREAGYVATYTSNIERMRISSTGHVGIGASNPDDFTSVGANNLVIGSGSGNAGTTVYSSATGYGNMAFADGTAASDQYRGLIQYDHTNDAMNLFTNAVSRMTIGGSGAVSVGPNAPQSTYASNANVEIGHSLLSSGKSFGDSFYGANTYLTTAGNWERKSAGAATLMAQDPTNGRIIYYSAGTGAAGSNISWNTTLTLDISGNLTATGNVTAYSDERLKDNIETLDGSKVYDMRGVSFTKDGEAGSGVIAQELQKVAPELVLEGEEYLSVAYGNLVGYLIEAVKGLKAEIEELKEAK